MSLNKIQKQMLEQNVQNKLDEIGILSKLTTNSKTSLVDSINETNEHLAHIETEKADKTYVDTITQSIASGSPKGVYPTLSDLQSTFPQGDNNIYVVVEDGKWYYWNGSWIAGGIYQGEGIVDGGVAINNVSFRKRTYNMFDISRMTSNKTISSTTGLLVDNASFSTTDFILYNADNLNANIASSGVYIGVYDENKSFIKRISFTDYRSGVETIPIGSYIRIAFSHNAYDPNNLCIYFSNKELPYIPYYLIDETYLPKELSLYDNDLGFLQKDELLKRTYNMFDVNKVHEGKTISNSTGNLTDTANYFTSDFIEFKSNNLKTNTPSSGAYIGVYNSDYSYIKRIALADYLNGSQTIDEGSLIRITFPYSQTTPDKVCIYFSDEEKPYAPYYVLDSNLLPTVKKPTGDLIEIILPKKLVAVVGHELNVYTDNVILCENLNNFDVRWSMSGNLGINLSDCYRISPKAEDVGTYTLTLSVYKDGELLQSESTQLLIIPEKTISNKKGIFIGDSLTNNGTYPKEVVEMCAGGFTSVGTRTTGDVQHEGRSGWSAHNYITQEEFKGYTNPFWNPSTSSFDFNYYMTSNGFSNVDYVFINLGTNDYANTERNITRINQMIASIHSYDPNIKIIVSLIIPPCKSQDAFGIYSGLSYTKRFKRAQMELVKAFIENYEDKGNIDVSPLYVNVDPIHDFPSVQQPLSSRNPTMVTRYNNNVHPNEYGYLKMADILYNWIQYANQ